MALNFGKGQLFKPSGLQQDTGLLSERWGQQGSNIINLEGNEIQFYVDGSLLYTVSANKTLYVSQFIISIEEALASSSFLYLKDGLTHSGADRLRIESGGVVIGDHLIFNFKTPLKFETGIFGRRGNTEDFQWNIVGWEE